MSNYSVSTYTFAAGLLSPEFWGQIDLDKQGMGFKTGDNFLVSSEGILEKRAGTEFIDDAVGQSRLVPFIYSKEQGYALAFNEGYIRIYRDGGYITQIVSPYAFTDVDGIRYCQVQDYMFMTHPSYPPKKLVRNTDTNWTLTDLVFIPDVSQVSSITTSHTGTVTVAQDWEYTATLVNSNGQEGQPIEGTVESADITIADTPITVVVNLPTLSGNPIMTDNFSPAGNVESDDESADAYLALDGNKTTQWAKPGESTGTWNYQFPEVFTVSFIAFFNTISTESYSNNIEIYIDGDVNNVIHTFTAKPGSAEATRVLLPSSIEVNQMGFNILDANNLQTATAVSLTDGGGFSRSAGTQNLTQFSTSGVGTGFAGTGTVVDAGTDYLGSFDSITSAGSGYEVGDTIALTVEGANSYNPRPEVTVTSISGDTIGISDVSFFSEEPADTVSIYRRPSESKHYQKIQDLKYNGADASVTLVDRGLTADETASPPEEFTDFGGVGNYPTACGIWNQRLLLGGTNNDPNTMWFSRILDYENFTSTPLLNEDESWKRELAEGEVNQISHFKTSGILIVFTTGNIWQVDGFTRNTLTAEVSSSIGSAIVDPTKTRKSILYLEENGNTISDFMYVRDVLGYDGNRLDLFARILFRGYTVRDLALSSAPDNRLYAVRSDGALLCLTYLKTQSLAAWSYLYTDGDFESICVIPKQNFDDIYVVVNRDGTRMLELLKHTLLPTEDVVDSWYVDSALQYNGAQTMQLDIVDTTATAASAIFAATNVDDKIIVDGTEYLITSYTSTTEVEVEDNGDVSTTDWVLTADVFSGLTHLAERTVSCLCDGDEKEVTVSAGGVAEFDETYSIIVIGLPYDVELETISTNIVTKNSGSTIPNSRRLVKFYIDLYGSRDVEWKTSLEGDDWQPLPQVDSLEMNEELDLISGKFDLPLISNNDLENTVFIRNVSPTPLNITNVTVHLSLDGVK